MVLTLYPSVHYHDSAKGIDWLVEYLGCKPLYLVEGPEGPHGRQVQHAELELGASAFFLGQKPPNTTASFGIYVGVSEAEIEALYKSLQQKGLSSPDLIFLRGPLSKVQAAAGYTRLSCCSEGSCPALCPLLMQTWLSWPDTARTRPEECNRMLFASGATFAKLMFTTPYDTKEFDVMDLENNIWTIGTYTPGSRGNGPGTHRRSYAGGLDKQA